MVPEPAKDREKKACPRAYTQVFGFFRYSHFGTNRYSYPAVACSRVNTRSIKRIKNTKNTGIMILFIFSMPLEIPKIIMRKVRPSPRKCHPTLPKFPEISPKYAAVSLVSINSPVTAPHRNRRNHPTTTEYPTAMAKDPSTGIIPSSFPPFFPRISMAFPKAPKGPVFMARPKAISPTTPENPRITTKIK